MPQAEMTSYCNYDYCHSTKAIPIIILTLFFVSISVKVTDAIRIGFNCLKELQLFISESYNTLCLCYATTIILVIIQKYINVYLLMTRIIAKLKQNMRYHIKCTIKLRKIFNRIFKFFRVMNVLCVVLD